MLKYEFQNMLAAQVGSHGVSQDELKELSIKLKDIHSSLVKDYKDGGLGFTHLPEDSEMIKQVEQVADNLQAKFKNLIVIGIGGSDLGARALLRALDQGQDLRVYFLGATTDPEEIKQILSEVDLKDTALNIVSKSGGTIEPMSTFLYLRDLLKQTVGADFASHIVATTDPESGILHDLAASEGYATLPVPPGVGGRFSVLSAVGLLPAAAAGIDIKKMLEGAGKLNNSILREDNLEKNQAMVFAALQYLAYIKHQQNVAVLMPYAARLDKLGQWFRQLWAESLGKAKSLDGQAVNVGQTPVAALGPTDQHSQLQLWNEGPYDKTITFIEVEHLREQLRLPGDLDFIKPLAYLQDVELGSILKIERVATAQSLAENQRPNGTLIMEKINEESLGALFMFFEWAVTYAGALLNINTFNQPGVERSKVLIKASLGAK